MPETKAGTSFKAVVLPRPRIGLGQDGLKTYLKTVHGPLCMAHSDVSDPFLSYVHHYSVDEAPSGFQAPILPDWGAVTVIRFYDQAAAAQSRAGAGYRDHVGPDEDNFREVEGTIAFMAREHIVRTGGNNAAFKVFLFRETARNSGQDIAHWAEQAEELCAKYGAAVQGFVTNGLNVMGGQSAFTQMDEIGLPSLEGSEAFASELIAAAHQFFAPAKTAMVVTEPFVFADRDLQSAQ